MDFVQKEDLLRLNDRILLSVSGGMDSVVMADLFSRSGLSFGMAHCNFKLRGTDADLDEAFVQELAGLYKVPFFNQSFETQQYAKENGISIQMAARHLRYEWFEQLRADNQYDKIATAHHLDDQIETFFINLIRGTGLSGLSGIPLKQGHIIRPLMFVFRSEIEEYLQKRRLKYRLDKSNLETRYLRNKIRLTILPEFSKIRKDFHLEITETIARIHHSNEILKDIIDRTREELLIWHGDEQWFSISRLKSLTPLRTWLYELLKCYDFNIQTIEDIIRGLDGIPGKEYYSPTHKLIRDRDELIIIPVHPVDETGPAQFSVFEGNSLIRKPLSMKFRILETAGFIPSQDPGKACLDAECLTFPLTIRKWQKGDYFYPLGMKQKKKLSDFFINNKFSRTQKEKTWLLCSGNNICWVIGHRIDERYKVTTSTKRILLAELMTGLDASIIQ